MSDGKDELERWIDDGVRRYAEAEPPLGMEARVLAALEQRRRRPWWRPWTVAVPVAALLAVVIGLSLQEKTRPQPAPAQVAKAGLSPTQPAPPPQAITPAPGRRAAAGARARTQRDALTGVSTVQQARRPETFPAPTPASEQEVLLASLATDPAATQTVAASAAHTAENIVISRVAIEPIEIPALRGPIPQGD